MVVPLGDSPNPRGFPLANYALIVVNVVVFLVISLPLMRTPSDPNDPVVQQYLQILSDTPGMHAVTAAQIYAYDIFVFEHGFRPSNPDLGDLFASLFLHGGFWHLFGNMLILWIYGDNVEHRLGRTRYLLAYFGTGVAAALFHLVFARDSALPMVGASGAISGVLGFYFRWFPHNKVRLLVLLFPFLMDVFIIPARLVLGFYLFVDNLLPFLLSDSGGAGVAYGAHIGGFIGGVAAAWIADRRQIATPPSEFAASTGAATPDSTQAALQAGRFEEAARQYFALPATAARDALSAEEVMELAAWLRRKGHPQAALTAYRRLLRRAHSPDAQAEANLGAGRVLLEDLDQPAEAYQHFLDALEGTSSPPVAAQARVALNTIVSRQKFQIGNQRRPNW